MKVSLKDDSKKKRTREKRVKLKEVAIGTLFRYATVSLDEALRAPGQWFYWRVADVGAAKTNRITVASCDMKLISERDDDHLIIVHEHELQISLAETEPVPEKEDESDTQ